MGLGEKMFGSARDRLGREVADRMREYDVVVEAVYEPERFRVSYLRRGEQNRGFAYLENIFRECEGVSAGERQARIAKLAAVVAARTPDTWDEVRPNLRPVLRSAGFGLGQDADKALCRRPAVPYLAELAVVDTPDAMAYVNRLNLDEWGVDEETMFAAARANMAETAMGTMERDQRGPAMIRFVDDGDGYLASLPLIDGWLAGMGARLGGRPVAFVIERNTLLVTVIGAEGRVDALVEIALSEYGEAVRAISPVPYTVDHDGRVVPYEVPRDHPSWPAIRRATSLLAANAYAPQTEYLKEKYEQETADVFVGSLQHFASPSGVEFTVATWTPGIVSHLPLADYVAFYDEARRDTLLVPWAAVAAEVGLVPLEGFDPPRYEVGGWPEADVMERLFAQSESP